MPTITLSAADVAGSTISNLHFGLNATADYQRFVDFRNTANNLIDGGLEIRTVRYPGGSETEKYFDITNWDNSLWDDGNGRSGTIIPMSEFMAYCVENGIQPVVVIPISNIMMVPAGSTLAVFDPGTEAALKTFVKAALEMMGDVGVDAFELGNEYWGTLGAVPYANVAGPAAIVVQEAIDEYMAENAVGAEFSDPDILAQLFVDASDGGFTPDILATRNIKALEAFEENGGFDAIDGLTAHFYFKDGKNLGQAHEHTYENIEIAMSYMYDMFQTWQNAAGPDRDLSFFITEWNTHLHVESYLGLQQVAPILEMFTQHLTHGVDSMQLWAMQYNNAAISAPNNQVNFMGEFLTLLQEKSVGMSALDIDIANTNLDIHAFSDGETAVMFVTSLVGSLQSVDLDLNTLFPWLDSYTLSNIGVDPNSLDGIYRNKVDWLPHLEPDAEMLLDTNVTFTTDANGMVTFNLDGYELVMIEFDLGPASDINGTAKDDMLTGTLYGETIFGGNKGDEIDGGGGNDVIFADGFGFSGQDTVHGNTGNDRIHGGNWNDLLFGDEGNDHLYGGDFHDFLFGGLGDDHLFGEVAHDTLFGEKGDDYLDGGVGNDTLHGGRDNDILKGNWGNDVLNGDDGNDILEGHAHNDTLNGGKGNDNLNGQWGDDTLDGGAGNDLIKGATGNDDLTGGTGADVFQFTAFHNTDTIRDFEDGVDMIEIIANPGTTFADIQLAQSGGDTILTFTQSGATLSVTLEGIAATQIDASDFIFA